MTKCAIWKSFAQTACAFLSFMASSSDAQVANPFGPPRSGVDPPRIPLSESPNVQLPIDAALAFELYFRRALNYSKQVPNLASPDSPAGFIATGLNLNAQEARRLMLIAEDAIERVESYRAKLEQGNCRERSIFSNKADLGRKLMSDANDLASYRATTWFDALSGIDESTREALTQAAAELRDGTFLMSETGDYVVLLQESTEPLDAVLDRLCTRVHAPRGDPGL